MTEARRICSLLPSATEIAYALGVGDRLVAVTHECDFPPEARDLPQVTSSIIDSDGLSAREIDEAVRQSLESNATIYLLDRGVMEQVRPDLILTQELCTVCAVGAGDVRDVVTQLPGNPEVVSLEPHTLGEVLGSVLRVGRLTGTLRRAIEVVDALTARIDAVREAVQGRDPVRVLTLEWVDPPFVGGHWVPEMVRIAGGVDVLGEAGQPSRQVDWDEIAASMPDVVVAMPCGFGVDRSEMELRRAALPRQWHDLEAVRRGQVYVVDGSSYFNRPGPRLVDGVEILAAMVHPEAFQGGPSSAFRRYEPDRLPLGRAQA